MSQLASTIAPSSNPIRFVEIVNFRLDYGAYDPANPKTHADGLLCPKGVAYNEVSKKLIVSLTPGGVQGDAQVLNAVRSDGLRTPFAPGLKTDVAEEANFAIVPSFGPATTVGGVRSWRRLCSSYRRANSSS